VLLTLGTLASDLLLCAIAPRIRYNELREINTVLGMSPRYNPGMTKLIEYRTDPPDANAFFSLFETTGWNAKYAATPADLARAVDASWSILSAYADGSLVGFGRVVSDGTMHAVLFDVIVHPDYQRRGIGSEILTRLVRVCREAAIRDIQLFAAHGKGPFYERHGFRVRPDGAPGMEYVGGDVM